MNIFLNERKTEVEQNTTVFQLRSMVKEDADIVVYNGFIIKEDYVLNENDKVVFIKKGEIPKLEDMEAMLLARHTPFVHNKIKECSVGIAGLGGLGSNVAVSLARVGIGRLVLVDFDVVEPSNLNRQQYFIKHLGMKKTHALEQIISDCNPFVRVEKKDAFLDENNIIDIFKDVDIIVEAFDNPVSKAVLVNTVLSKMKDKKIIAASGMAGYFSSNTIATKKIKDNFYLIGDGENEAKPGCGLMAPRVAIAANHQANAVLRVILGEE
ncbi:sulfur carrier protein ThiS adenylyltransferase ThiF [Clostridium sp. DJ247]|uniref:sulfur carrier protein ThiS adenylyltransferase ThiF n=1 Tax=Clostridium sp. DJ247 TaxID=2726188 RepID=UPI001626C92B|nr:sulfur carrier protein ThiS adenylyltransferase ThiF [Clostridium sp. DJ247]MBC2581838.1 sulfur carrier protein ThiS adenylyltransferase ThiF [Clostridium sp. DJ247]